MSSFTDKCAECLRPLTARRLNTHYCSGMCASAGASNREGLHAFLRADAMARRAVELWKHGADWRAMVAPKSKLEKRLCDGAVYDAAKGLHSASPGQGAPASPG